MKRCTVLLLVGLVSGPAFASESIPREASSGPLAASASREMSRLVRSLAPGTRQAPAQPQPTNKGWVARHPRLTGALIGFGVGCVAGASQVGGSTDTFFNALDEFACPVVGGIGAGAGFAIGSLFK